MKIGAFSLEIPEGKEVDGGYVVLSHGQQYSLGLRSDHSGECSVAVSIDGERVGCWRLRPGVTCRIERPASEPGKFTFYVAQTGEAKMAGIVKTDRTGLISARFVPEKARPELNCRFSLSRDVPDGRFMPGKGRPENDREVSNPLSPGPIPAGPPAGAMAGGTGLSGFSSQTFKKATNRIEHDFDAAVTINLRLIAMSEVPRPLHRSNPVPPPVT